jgi:hypothetical protein
MDIRKKLGEIGMSADDIKTFESSVEKMINEQAEARVVSESTRLQKKYDIAAEEYCNKMIAEGVETAKAELIKEYDAKVDQLDVAVEKTLDTFLESEILPQISDEIVGKLALNEAFAPIVNGMKALLENNFVAVDSDGSKLLSEAKQEILKLKKDASDAMAKNIQLNERLEKTATFMLINEKCEGLSKDSKKRVVAMFEGKSFDETENRISEYVEFLVESENKNVGDKPVGVVTEEQTKEEEVLSEENTKDESDVVNSADRLL